MADSITLNNYSDDAQIKRYISDVLMPRVFKNIPLNILNTGQFSIINEYMSQAIENLSFTASFYHNESFITKAMLADSIYSEAAIFNLGYSYATPSCCNFMLELRIADLLKNATFNSDNGLYEFILDKNTKFNLSNGTMYSLDYDILIQFKNEATATINSKAPAWNVQYINMDQMNSIAVNKDPYILYRVSETWLCLFVKCSEYERETHIVVNNMTNGIPNEDTLITCKDHIAGFDIKYIDGSGNEEYIPHDHILPIHSDVKDQNPYVHYIMDSPKTIRFMYQLNGTRYFVPKLNSSYEITVYTCHGEAANFESFKIDEQPGVITSSSKYSNNGNVMKAAFVISGSKAGTNIGTIETTRRETIEAYNTANVISSDHDIEEWFNTFHFKNVLYPFFFKRRDDPWGRIWSGFIALKDASDEVFRTNTLHAKIPYQQLYSNAKGSSGTFSTNEIIIPPGIAWVYTQDDGRKFTVKPLLNDNGKFETAKTSLSISDKFIFANPFGIRIQKSPFAIGYFNPWINLSVTASNIPIEHTYSENEDDTALIYHATPTFVNMTRNFVEDFYRLTVIISPTTVNTINGGKFVNVTKSMIAEPSFNQDMWNFFEKPSELYEVNVPVLIQNPKDKYVLFNPEKTYMCVRSRVTETTDPTKVLLSDFWIEEEKYDEYNNPITKITPMRIQGYDRFIGASELWGDTGVCMNYAVKQSNDTTITISGSIPVGDDKIFIFKQVPNQLYYELRAKTTDEVQTFNLIEIRVPWESVTEETHRAFNEQELYRIGDKNKDVSMTIKYQTGLNDNETGVSFTVMNAKDVFIPYKPDHDSLTDEAVFDLSRLQPSDKQDIGVIILYANMKPQPSVDSVLYVRVPFSALTPTPDIPMFNMINSQIPLENNILRVLLDARVNGSPTGWIEMIPKRIDSDGSIEFEAIMNPLNELLDSDNRIHIASTARGGGSWNPTRLGSDVILDAIKPEMQIAILFKSDDDQYPSEFMNNSDYIGYRMMDRWQIDDLSLVQELKEMRSVVKFGENKIPSSNEINAYNDLLELSNQDSDEDNLNTIGEYARYRSQGWSEDIRPFADIQRISTDMLIEMDTILRSYGMKYQIKKVSIVNGGNPKGGETSKYGLEPVRIVFNNHTTSKGAFLVDGYVDAQNPEGPVWDIVPITESGARDWTMPNEYPITVDYEDIDWNAMTGGSEIAELSTVRVGKKENIGSDLTVSIAASDVIQRSSIPSVRSNPDFMRLQMMLSMIQNAATPGDLSQQEWAEVYVLIASYPATISECFAGTSVESSVEIQLVPFVQYTLMNSEKFDEFVSSFTQIHKAIEPVIFKRLEGNNYLDCKLIATYGYPHSYASDINKRLYDSGNYTEAEASALFWPSLDVQIEFDVHLFNPGMETITFKEIRNIIKSYFNRLTSIHTPIDMISMDNNIYISQLIQQLESHPNVAFLKFKGWYTDEKDKPNGSYMNADYQCIVQMWDSIEDFPKKELERFVPEMFVLDDASIILNSI